MKINWVRGLIAIIAVAIGLVLGYSMDVPRQEVNNSLPPSLEARYRFNQEIMKWRQRLAQVAGALRGQ